MLPIDPAGPGGLHPSTCWANMQQSCMSSQAWLCRHKKLLLAGGEKPAHLMHETDCETSQSHNPSLPELQLLDCSRIYAPLDRAASDRYQHKDAPPVLL